MPHITETCFIRIQRQNTYSEPEIEVIANRLHMLGAKSVEITSANINGRMFAAVKKLSEKFVCLAPL